MNQMVNGEWTPEPFRPRLVGGAYARPESQFRDRVTADGRSGFAAARGRYHLYVSLACPWAHRTLIVRRLKGLEEAVSVSVVHPYMGERGWNGSAVHSPLTIWFIEKGPCLGVGCARVVLSA